MRERREADISFLLTPQVRCRASYFLCPEKSSRNQRLLRNVFLKANRFINKVFVHFRFAIT